MSAASVMDSSARLGRLAKYAFPSVSDADGSAGLDVMTGADAHLDQVLGGCCLEVQALVADAPGVGSPVARIDRAIAVHFGWEVGDGIDAMWSGA